MPIDNPTGLKAMKRKMERNQNQKCEKMCIITYNITDDVALLTPV